MEVATSPGISILIHKTKWRQFHEAVIIVLTYVRTSYLIVIVIHVAVQVVGGLSCNRTLKHTCQS